ncbi:MAG: hypothetical protein DF168_00220 [Candidatus Moanabacter tarae]|uniref:Uncharacterized protein n=1 Tax=Candidatus Moanibacter tarae TaxID=2200854 RepID=A0A2Z4ADU8_9BACT|nr:MAG: hypothetical protein DF168_00220 [Candidatus Moanabacter tarae]
MNIDRFVVWSTYLGRIFAILSGAVNGSSIIIGLCFLEESVMHKGTVRRLNI